MLGDFILFLIFFGDPGLKGIGRATCIALAKHGAEVIGFSRTQSDLDSLRNEVSVVASKQAAMT